MAVDFRRGFGRVCLVLSVVVAALAVLREFYGHDRPFLKQFIPHSKAGIVQLPDGAFLGAVESLVDDRFVSEREGSALFRRRYCHERSSEEEVARAQQPAAEMERDLDKLRSSGQQHVSRYGRIDWVPTQIALYAIMAIWLIITLSSTLLAVSFLDVATCGKNKVPLDWMPKFIQNLNTCYTTYLRHPK